MPTQDTQRSDERLYGILSKVQRLKSENEPRKVLVNCFEEKKQKRKDKETERRQHYSNQERNGQIQLFEKRDPGIQIQDCSHQSVKDKTANKHQDVSIVAEFDD